MRNSKDGAQAGRRPLRTRCAAAGLAGLVALALVVSTAPGQPNATGQYLPGDSGQRVSDSKAPEEMQALRGQVESLEVGARAQEKVVSMVVTFMEIFLAGFTILIAIAAFLGWNDRRGLKEEAESERQAAKALREQAEQTLKRADEVERQASLVRKEAEDSSVQARQMLTNAETMSREIEVLLGRAAAAVQVAEKNTETITVMRDGQSRAWKDIDGAMDGLPELDLSVVVDGLPDPKVTPEVSAIFTDADTILMVCDRLGLQDDPRRGADHFRKLANFWRAAQDFPRAVRRLERARELVPEHCQVLLDLAITLAEWSASEEDARPASRQRLERALILLQEAERYCGVEQPVLLFNRAWVLDELGEPGAAADCLLAAQKQEEKAARESGREPRSSITYNLAAALAKAGNLDAALEELERIIRRDENWNAADSDRDFDALRNSPLHAEALRRMLDEARADV